MTEIEKLDTSIDAPAEPQIHMPKVSTIARETNYERLHRRSQTQINVIKPISQARFSVYLVNCRSTRQNYAMKVFPVEDGETHPYFKNEIRFASFTHPNIIRTQYIEQAKNISSSESTMPSSISFILIEYAPYGDFFDFVTSYKEALNEKLIRTYFRQLIYGLEYIHSKGAAHLDIKLENLLIGEDFMLKVADFDLSYLEGDSTILTKGTQYYRAPELIEEKCENCQVADIYSAGVVLFVLKSGGIIPHSENSLHKGIDLFDLLNNKNEEFWNRHCEIQHRKADYFDSDFKELFNQMTKVNPKERITIEGIKASKWFKGAVYTQGELKKYINALINNV